MNWADQSYCLGRGVAGIHAKTGRDDTQFIFYSLVSELPRLLSRCAGSVFPNLSRSDLLTFPIAWPPAAERRRAARILSALDQKIELNRRMNRTLESIARAIFKSWFIDFDPVRKKMEGKMGGEFGLPPSLAALFPDSFAETGLPEGWRWGSPEEFISLQIGGDWGLAEATDDCGERVFCVRGADIPPLQAGGVGEPPVRYLKPRSLQKRLLQDGDLVLEASGGSPTQSTGRCALITDGVLRRLSRRVVCSNFCRAIRPIDQSFALYIYFWLRAIYDQGLLFGFENGTTGIKNLAIAEFVREPIMPFSPTGVIAAFGERVAPFMAMRETLALEADALGRQRDLLVRELLSGELAVGDSLEVPA